MRKKITAVLLTGLSTVLLASCQFKPEGALQASCWDATFNGKALQVAKDIEGATEYGLDVVVGEKDPIVQSATAAFGSGDLSALPDIIQVEDYTAPGWLEIYGDYFYPVQNAGVTADDFAAIKSEYASYNGTLYGLPFDASPSGCFIKIADLVKYGIIVDDTKTTTALDDTETENKYQAYHTSPAITDNSSVQAPAGIDVTADRIDTAAVKTALANDEDKTRPVTLSDLKKGDWTWWDYINIGIKYSEYCNDHPNDIAPGTNTKLSDTFWWGLRSGDIGTFRQMLMSGNAWYERKDKSTDKWVSDLQQEDGTPNPVAVEALNIYKCMFNLTNRTDYSTESASYNAFNGVTMTSCTASWSQPSLMKQTEQKDLWTIVQMPHMTTGSKGNFSSLGGSAFFVIDRGDEDRAQAAAEWLVNSFGDLSSGSNGYKIANQLINAYDANDPSSGAGALLSVNGAANLPNYSVAQDFYYDDMVFGSVMTEWNEALKDPVAYGPYTYNCETAANTDVYNFCVGQTTMSASELLEDITNNFNLTVFNAQ